MEKVEASVIGVTIGGLYGVVLWGSNEAFALASFMLYGNKYLIPVSIAGFIAFLALALVFTHTIWVNWVTDALVWLENTFGEEDELE